jgi:hypothetical protein
MTVHGMKDALLALLKKIGFDEKHDHLILAGDMVSKGPDSAGVVDLAVKLGATGVRGNHEDRLILANTAMEKDIVAEYLNTEEVADVLSPRDIKDRELIQELGKKRIKWLENCPVILRIGKVADLGEVVVVHAGLAPGVELEKQDPLAVMTMRTVGEDHLPSEEHDGHPWTKVCD